MRPFFRRLGGFDGELTVDSAGKPGHASPILCASFSPTGKLLATGSGDNTCRLWNLDTETPQSTLTGHTGWLLCVEWDGLERTVATGSMDNTVSVDGARRREVWALIVVSHAKVRLWDPKTGKAIGDALRGHQKWITSLAWEPVHLYAVLALPWSAR